MEKYTMFMDWPNPAGTLRSESEMERKLRFLPPIEMRPSFISSNLVESREAPLTPQYPSPLTDKMQPPWNLARPIPLPTTWRRCEKIINRTNWGNISLPSLQPVLRAPPQKCPRCVFGRGESRGQRQLHDCETCTSETK